MARVLIVANETIGGARLLEAVRARKGEGASFHICIPRGTPRHGNLIYDEAVYDAAQVRLDLARSFLHDHEGIDAGGEVGDPDPYQATLDAVAEYRPDEIIISTYPVGASGWMRRDLIGRVESATRLPVEHVVADLEAEGLPFAVTLVLANRTAGSDALLASLRRHAEGGERLFIVVVPQEGRGGVSAQNARNRLTSLLERIRGADLLAAGMIGDPDPYTAAMNALQFFRIEDIVVSTLPRTRSGWLRADLIERLHKASGVAVEHVTAQEAAAAEAA